MSAPQSDRPVGRRVENLVAGLDRLWEWLLGLPGLIFAIGLCALAVVRSGVHHAEYEMQAWLTLTANFPVPRDDWRANSVVGPAIGSLFGITTQWQWVLLHGVIIAGVAGLAAWCLLDRFPDRASRWLAAVWLALGSVPTVLLQKVGSYDPYTVAGCLLVVLGGRTGTAMLGGVLVGLTSAEQGAVGLVGAALMVLLLAKGDGSDDPAERAPAEAGRGGSDALSRLRRAPTGEHILVGLAALLVARVALLLSFSVRGGTVPSRGSVMGDLLGDSLLNATASAGAGVYAWFGLAWLVLLVVWLTGPWSPRHMAAIVAALVAAPAAATFVTLDGTRVFVMVALPAFLVLLAWLVDRLGHLGEADVAIVSRITMAALIASPLVPALIAEPAGNPWFVFPWMI